MRLVYGSFQREARNAGWEETAVRLLFEGAAGHAGGDEVHMSKKILRQDSFGTREQIVMRYMHRIHVFLQFTMRDALCGLPLRMHAEPEDIDPDIADTPPRPWPLVAQKHAAKLYNMLIQHLFGEAALSGNSFQVVKIQGVDHAYFSITQPRNADGVIQLPKFIQEAG
jgi:hypothetical protein